MRRVALVLLLACACGHPAGHGDPAAPGASAMHVPQLLPPTPIDLRRPGAAYLVAIAQHLEPGWHQFLEDCRIRLAATHPLNDMNLAAFAELVIDARGNVKAGGVQSSGNRDFDQAVHDVIADVTQVPPPPSDWLADDDQAHVVWMFARDRRQAGPSTAQIIPHDLPLMDIVPRRIAEHDLARAARRILAAPPIANGRQEAAEAVFVGALAEALERGDAQVQRQALEAIARVPTSGLETAVRDKLGAPDRAVRLAAVEAAADDPAAKDLIEDRVLADLDADPEAALRELIALRRTASDEVAALAQSFAESHAVPAPAAIGVLDLLPSEVFSKRVDAMWEHGDPPMRAAVCDAVHGRWKLTHGTEEPRIDLLVERGLSERVALVRAHCASATPFLLRRPARVAQRVRALTSDRDASVRAAAVAALVVLEPGRHVRAVGDASVEVRVAYASALATAISIAGMPQPVVDLEALLEDRNGEVRAAAWRSYTVNAVAPPEQLAKLAARAMRDDNAGVRAVAASVVDDDAVLAHAAASDDSPEVRTAALIALARRNGVGIHDSLLEQLAAAPPASEERVRIALAGLLAH
jgi:HEAT repeat protein